MNPASDPAIRQTFNIAGKNRRLGTYIAGTPGFGKSSLIQQMALYDIRRGRGVCVIDPTNDLISSIKHWIPRERVKDTIYFSTANPIPLDFFSYAPDGKDREMLFNDLISMFHLVAAPIAEPILMEVIAILFDANENGCDCTFFDIERFCMWPERQQYILRHVSQERNSSWERGKFSPKDLAPIVGRMRRFKESRALLRILDVPKKDGYKLLNIAEVMAKNQILLVDIEDTETDYFIGSLFASKFQQAAFNRRHIPEPQRVPYYLYIDECEDIIGYADKTFDKILKRARKYRLCLTVANQLPSKLPERMQKSLSMFGNLIFFNLNPTDAHLVHRLFDKDTLDRLCHLSEFRALVRTDGQYGFHPMRRYLSKSNASYAKSIEMQTAQDYPLQKHTFGLELLEDVQSDTVNPVSRPQPSKGNKRPR